MLDSPLPSAGRNRFSHNANSLVARAVPADGCAAPGGLLPVDHLELGWLLGLPGLTLIHTDPRQFQ